MPFIEGYLASPDWSVTLTIAGRSASMVRLAESASRRMLTVFSSRLRLAPSVAAGQLRRSAIMAGTTPPPSVEAMPQITRSGAALAIAAASTALVARRQNRALLRR